MGERGDYFGGIINPIIGLATILLIVITIRIQRRELKSSLEELRTSNYAISRQSFENSFFSWLNTYHRLLESITVPKSAFRQGGEMGRHALQLMFENNFSTYTVWSSDELPLVNRLPDGKELHVHQPEYWQHIPSTQRLSHINRLKRRYQDLFESQRYQFDGLFRTLYRLLKWVDEHNQLETEDKWFYVAIIRAQLSWIEMAYVLYNCLTTGPQMRSYANKYALFDNLGTGVDPIISLIRIESDQLGLGATAYHSRRARHHLGLD